MTSTGTRASKVKAATADVNGTQLYHEVRGSGPPVIFISGSLGDAGGWDLVAELLADEFTVVTYDRRGNSRSPRPAGWDTTSIEEQADDAAGLIEALGLAPAAVYGNSSGGTIALDLVLRHPEVVRGAILHEPWLPWLFEDLEAALEPIKSAIERGMAAGGSTGAVEGFVRLVAGDAAYEALPPDRRERILGNGETLLIESPMDEDYHPDDAALASLRRPVQIMVGRETPPYLAESPHRLAELLGSEVIPMPGAHTPQLDHPAEMVEAIRPFLGRVG